MDISFDEHNNLCYLKMRVTKNIFNRCGFDERALKCFASTFVGTVD